MGIKISCGDPLPGGTVLLRLECDVASDIFCRGFESFETGEGFIGCHALAMKAGWLERQDGERKWLCPRCSGK